MKKHLTVPLLASMTMMVLSPQVSAMEMGVSQNGRISIYDEESMDQMETQEPNDSAEKPVVGSRYQNRVNVNPDSQRIQVNLRNDQTDPGTGLENMESTRVEKFKMEFPYSQTERQQDLMEKRAENAENLQTKLGERQEYLESLKVQRQERVDAMVEVRNRVGENGEQELEMESMGVVARLRRAEFNFDPETGVVTVTTPSGEEHVLNHFPDQALDRIRAVHLEDDIESTLDGEDVEVEENEDGVVEYRALGRRKAKFLGLFSRDIETEVVLDDETGEVTEEDLPATSFLDNVLDTLSF